MPQEKLSMRKIREVLRLQHEMKLSNRAIAKACRISNSTVGEYVKRAKQAQVGWPLPPCSETELYERLFPEKKKATEETRPLPKWEDMHRELAKRGVTLTLVWQEYRERCVDGYGFTQFRVHYQKWNKAHTNSMRLPHKGGEAMEVDYAGMTVPIVNPETGEVTLAETFVAVLPASNYIYVEIQASQELCHWLGGHVRALDFFGGVPQMVRPDNLKSGVKSAHRYEPELNPSYQEFAEHYQLAVLPARVRRPKDKAHVENSVQNVERRVLAPLRARTFFSIAEANRAIAPLLQALNESEMKHLKTSRKQQFVEIDQPALRPLPERAYEFATWKNAKVSLDYHVIFSGHHYSVPYELVGEQISLRATENLLQIFHHGQQVAVHPRSASLGRFSTLPQHMPANHEFVLHADAEWFLQQTNKIGVHTTAYVSALLHACAYPPQAFRSCLGILSLARKHAPARMENACQQLLLQRLLSYRDLKFELDHQSLEITTCSFPVHENVRGNNYYH